MDVEKLFSRAFRRNPAILVISTFTDGKIIEVNDSFLDTFGFTRAEVIGRTSTVLGVWQDPGDRVRFLEELQQHGAIRDREVRLRSKSGGQVTLEFSGEVIDMAGERCLMIMGLDVTARRKAESFLRESEGRYRLLADNIHDVIWQLDSEMRFVYVSPSNEHLCGFRPDEILGRSVWEFMSPESMAQARATARERMGAREAGEQTGPVTMEVEHLCKGGGTVWVESSSTPLYDDQGRVVGFVGVTRDISNRKKIEDELTTQSRVLEAMAEGVSLVDADGAITFTNRAFDAMFGYERGDLLGRHVSALNDLSSGENESLVLEVMGAIERTGEYAGDFRNRKKDGTPFTTFARISVLKLSGVRHFVSVQEDITEYRRMQEAVAESEKMATALLNASTQPIMLIDTEGTVLTANAAMFQRLGREIDDLAGRNAFDLLPAEVAEGRRQRLAEVVRTRRSLRFEDENGGRVLDSVINPVLGPDGAVTAVAVFVNDITERIETEDALLKAKERAEAASRAKSEFLATMSHELRTPLNGIVGIAQLLAMTGLDKTQQEYLSAITLSGSNMLSLVNDILDISRIEAEKVELEYADFSLRNCINDVIKMQQSRIAGKRLNLRTDIPAAIPDALMGDQLRVKQILINLLSNAVKFTEAGSILISASTREPQGNKMLLELTVQDTGIGMTEEVLGRVFEPFFQSGNGFTRLYGGTGLGLAISRHLAELMGGALTAESSVGVGSTFRLVLPFVVVSQTTAPSAPAARSPAEMWDGPTLRILFAEDNRTNTFFGVSLLTLMGHQVTAVENGREALAAMERGTFDLVLMDVQMPVMNGDEALAVIRERIPESGRPIPVIAVTAYAMKGEEERLLAAGFDGYVAKPLELRKLTDAMKRAISSCVPCG